MECNTFIAKMQVPQAGEPVAAKSVCQALLRVKDRRGKRGQRYPAPVTQSFLVQPTNLPGPAQIVFLPLISR